MSYQPSNFDPFGDRGTGYGVRSYVQVGTDAARQRQYAQTPGPSGRPGHRPTASYSALPDDDLVPPMGAYPRLPRVNPAPPARPMTTAPDPYGAAGARQVAAYALPPIRQHLAGPLSPPLRNAPPQMRQPHLLPQQFVAPPPGARSATTYPAATDLVHACSRDGCGRRFAHRNELDQHEKAHKNQEKPCACPYPGCSWRFDFPSDVKLHLACHTQERPWECTYPGCDKRYQRRHDLHRHVRDKHPGHVIPGQ